MKKKMSAGYLISRVIIWAVVILLTLSCLLPLINMVAISLSGSDAVAANEVGLLPKDHVRPRDNPLLVTAGSMGPEVCAPRAAAGEHPEPHVL